MLSHWFTYCHRRIKDTWILGHFHNLSLKQGAFTWEGQTHQCTKGRISLPTKSLCNAIKPFMKTSVYNQNNFSRALHSMLKLYCIRSIALMPNDNRKLDAFNQLRIENTVKGVLTIEKHNSRLIIKEVDFSWFQVQKMILVIFNIT